MKPGHRILPVPARPTKAQLDRLRAIPVPNLSDALGKLLAPGGGLKPWHRVSAPMVGTAVTVRSPPGDNLMTHKAIHMAEPGEVVVVDAGGVLEQALVGELMTAWARQRGLAGIVIHGAVRDVDVLAQSDFPVYARGYTHRGPQRQGPGEINGVIAIDGMVVSPGDAVVGDANGVLTIPLALIDEVTEAAIAIQQREARLLADIEAGSYEPAWLDQALADAGYEA